MILLLIDNIPLQILLLLVVSFAASLLTFYSGFGLGTLLLPVFALNFPVEQAILMTAIVHFSNGVFKLWMMRNHIDIILFMRFGVAATLGALLGAFSLAFINSVSINYPLSLGPWTGSITLVNVIIGLLIIVFGLLEFVEFGKKPWGIGSMTLGGLLSGFFGGLSGHQGALRSAFMIRYPLSKEVFIGTGVAIACLVDVTRLAVYIPDIVRGDLSPSFYLIGISILAAISGAWVGNRYLKKLNILSIKRVTAICIVIMGIAILLGLI